jgi:hypothetical protein
MSDAQILRQYLYATDDAIIDTLYEAIGTRTIRSFRTMRTQEPMDIKYQLSIDGIDYFYNTESSMLQFPVGKSGFIVVQLMSDSTRSA